MDWDDVIDTVVGILNLPAVDGGLRSVDSNFNAEKDEPASVATFPRAFVTMVAGGMDEQAAGGNSYRMGTENMTATLYVSIAVASATTAPNIAWPLARRFILPLFDLLDLKLDINGTDVVQQQPGRRWEMIGIRAPAQKFAGVGFYVPLWFQRERPLPA